MIKKSYYDEINNYSVVDINMTYLELNCYKKIALILPLLCLMTSTSHARNLNDWIAKFVSDEESKEGKTEDDYNYLLQHKDIITTDFDKDGKKDAIVILDFCEENNCHSTTTYSKIYPLLGLGSGQYNKLSIIETEGYADVKFLNNQLIVKTKEYGDDDPSCCRSLNVTRTYVYSKNHYGFAETKKTVQIKKYQ